MPADYRDLSLESIANDDDDDEIPDIGELLGFRITGGRDFFMPITIFHVKDKTRAHRANLKLGDAILNVNGKDISHMTLREANRFLANASDAELTLHVSKFDSHNDDDDEYVQTIEEVVLEGPASLELKLKAMQKQLLEMTDVPPQIQAKVAMISKALEHFMTMDDAEALEESIERESNSNTEENVNEDEQNQFEEEPSLMVQQSERNEKQFSSIPEEDEDEVDEDEEGNINELYSTRETSYSLDDMDQNEEILYDDDEEEENVDEESENEEVIVKTEEEIRLEDEKRKKQEKLQKLEQHWQKLCTNTKTIHKRSNCHLVPSVALIHNKIHQLNESKIISFYERQRSP